MKKYKLFNEEMRSTFGGGGYYAKIGINEADNPFHELSYATGDKILDYYQGHGFLISEVNSVSGYEEHRAILPSRLGEYSCQAIEVSESRILYDESVLRELDAYQGLEYLEPTGFICDIIAIGNREIDCGNNIDGSRIYKSFNPYATIDFLMYEKLWVNKVDFEEIAEFCAKENQLDFLKYLNKIVTNIDLSKALEVAQSINNKDIVNYIVQSDHIYSIIPSLQSEHVDRLDKFELACKLLKEPIKTIRNILAHKKIETEKFPMGRKDYEFTGIR